MSRARPGDRPLVLTMGEPAGIGGEIALKAWLARENGLPPFFLVDDAARLRALAGSLGLPVPVRAVSGADDALGVFAEALPVLDRPLPRPSLPGRPDPANTAAVTGAIETAVTLVRSGEASAVVTNPIHKKALYQGGFPFPGHTEYLATLAGGECRPVMMLACAALRVVPVTVHVSLKRATEMLRVEDIVASASVTHAALRHDFGIRQPKLAVAGLNPHAGEDGEMGGEEAAIIAPAVAMLREEGMDVTGPLAPDAMFSPRARAGYDAAICMYHDQALIPLKALDFDGGVNVTLGLPFVRTSPGHGTALDIAGSGRASEASLVAALSLARDIAERRARAAA
ncbi:MAG: 4-hydroxythreonine-4-phosphate dehydrogenase PdxA [Rhodospirillales bacterium]